MKPFSNTLQIMDLVSVYFNNPFFSHFAKLIGKRTSIYSKIISQFLPVKGDRKPAAPSPGKNRKAVFPGWISVPYEGFFWKVPGSSSP